MYDRFCGFYNTMCLRFYIIRITKLGVFVLPILFREVTTTTSPSKDNFDIFSARHHPNALKVCHIIILFTSISL